MSNALAIAAVTATLRNVISNDPSLPPGTHVTAQSPEEAHDSTLNNQINLFLYQILHNAAWRNRDIPSRVKSGETASPFESTGLDPMAVPVPEQSESFGP